MEKHLKVILVFCLAALVSVSVAGCKKKGSGINDVNIGGEIIIPPDTNDFTLYSEDSNTAIYKMVYFDYDKSDVKAEYRPILENIAADLKATPNKHLLIEGHCDERGTNEYNLALGERRALAVREYLVNLGTDPTVLHTISYGEERPIELGHDESAWKFNRRAEFKTLIAD